MAQTGPATSVDGNLLHKLFKENNELRLKLHTIQRELFNKTVQLETLEDEFRSLKANNEEKDKSLTKQSSSSRPSTGRGRQNNMTGIGLSATKLSSRTEMDGKELSPAQMMELISAKEMELQKMADELEEQRSLVEELSQNVEQLESSLGEQQKENFELRESLMEKQESAEVNDDSSNNLNAYQNELENLKRQIKSSEDSNEILRKQLSTISIEANKKNNDLQNQLQGVESLVEGIKREYDEFLEITKLENDSQRTLQMQEYARLQQEHDINKASYMQDKRKLLTEFQNLLYSLQTQFEEYRTMSEFLFNLELSKVEDELSLQSQKYEQEMIYIVQAKDKFYSEMMIAKDAKIMSLIEGSDLQNLIQKHEIDIENLRKEHAREIAKIRDERDSEQKNMILNIQKQNSLLESKCDKLQTHAKSLETKLRELVNTVEAKNRIIHDKEELKKKTEEDYQVLLDVANNKIKSLTQEKEHLRHRIIRMSMDAKGEGQNNMENMIKRVGRETLELHKEFENITKQYADTVNNVESLKRNIKEKEKLITFLEKQIGLRNDEIANLTRTFERYLISRTKYKQFEDSEKAKEKQKRLQEALAESQNQKKKAMMMKINKNLDATSLPEIVPAIPFKPPKARNDKNAHMFAERDTLDLQQGFAYLKRFKLLSKAFEVDNMKKFAILALGETEESSIEKDSSSDLSNRSSYEDKITKMSIGTRIFDVENDTKQISSNNEIIANINNEDFSPVATKASFYVAVSNAGTVPNPEKYVPRSEGASVTPTKMTPKGKLFLQGEKMKKVDSINQ